MTCSYCGESMIGDGYTTVIHCPNLDLIGEGYEPDANPVHCTGEYEDEAWDSDGPLADIPV